MGLQRTATHFLLKKQLFVFFKSIDFSCFILDIKILRQHNKKINIWRLYFAYVQNYVESKCKVIPRNRFI